MRRSVRAVGVAAVAALALVSLTACRTNVGSAAVINGHSIGESTVDSYAAGGAVLSSSDSSTKIGPRQIALFYLVQQQVQNRILATPIGSKLTAGAIDSAVDAAVQGDGGKEKVVQALGLQSFPARLSDLAIRQEVVFFTLANDLGLSSDQESVVGLAQVVGLKASDFRVTVNPRYGSWDASKLSLDIDGGLPSYLKLQTTAAAQPSS